jgi:hypothetical protein
MMMAWNPGWDTEWLTFPSFPTALEEKHRGSLSIRLPPFLPNPFLLFINLSSYIF